MRTHIIGVFGLAHVDGWLVGIVVDDQRLIPLRLRLLYVIGLEFPHESFVSQRAANLLGKGAVAARHEGKVC